MSEQPKSLRIADALKASWGALEMDDVDREAEAELRRLHAENVLLHERHHFDNGVLAELLEALKECLPYVGQTLANTGSMDAYYTEAKACAAIARAEGQA